MQVTIDFISDSFNKFNKLYFNGELRTPIFEITMTKSFLGQFSWKYGIYKIRISNYFNRSEKDYQNTIIHEMIHQYIRQNNIKDSNKHHGNVFYSIANRINAQGGWHISRTTNVTGCSVNKKEEYMVICYIDSEDRYFKFVINPNYKNYYIDWFNKCPNSVKDWVIIKSNDSVKYGNMRKCRKNICGRYVSQNEFENMKNESFLKKVA